MHSPGGVVHGLLIHSFIYFWPKQFSHILSSFFLFSSEIVRLSPLALALRRGRGFRGLIRRLPRAKDEEVIVYLKREREWDTLGQNYRLKRRQMCGPKERVGEERRREKGCRNYGSQNHPLWPGLARSIIRRRLECFQPLRTKKGQ